MALVLGAQDLQRKPALMTFAYSTQSQGTIKRRWADLIMLGKTNLALIFAVNLAAFVLLIGVTVWILVSLGVKQWSTDLFCVVLLSAAGGTAPDIVRLLNLLRGVGYTRRTQQAELNQIVQDAKEHMNRQPREDAR